MYKLIVVLLLTGFIVNAALTVKSDFVNVRVNRTNNIEQACNQ